MKSILVDQDTDDGKECLDILSGLEIAGPKCDTDDLPISIYKGHAGDKDFYEISFYGRSRDVKSGDEEYSALDRIFQKYEKIED